jgi:lipopolysaccharide transport system permease protein
MTTTANGDRRPHLVIRPRSRWAPVNVAELWEFRDLLRAFAVRDVKLRYRQTALGAIWVVLQPLLAAGIFSFVFGSVAKLPSDNVPYFVFSFAGLLAWNAFSSTITKASASMVANQAMVSKVFFPRMLLPISVIKLRSVVFQNVQLQLCCASVALQQSGLLPP